MLRVRVRARARVRARVRVDALLRRQQYARLYRHQHVGRTTSVDLARLAVDDELAH
jgi:hypothetical protein